eukprot:283245_1
MATSKQSINQNKWLVFILIIIAQFGCWMIQTGFLKTQKESNFKRVIENTNITSNEYYKNIPTAVDILIPLIGGIFCDKLGSVKVLLSFQSMIVVAQVINYMIQYDKCTSVLLILARISLNVGRAGFAISRFSTIVHYFRDSGYLLFAINTYAIFFITIHTNIKEAYPDFVKRDGYMIYIACAVIGIISTVYILMIENKEYKIDNVQTKVENNLEIHVTKNEKKSTNAISPKQEGEESSNGLFNIVTIFWYLLILNLFNIQSMPSTKAQIYGIDAHALIYGIVRCISPLIAWIFDKIIKQHANKLLKLGFCAILISHATIRSGMSVDGGMCYLFLFGDTILRMCLYLCSMLVVDRKCIGKASGIWFSAIAVATFIRGYLLNSSQEDNNHDVRLFMFVCSIVGAIAVYKWGITIQRSLNLA